MRDVTPLPDLLHGRSHTGPVRERRPVYVDLLPPCNAGCPAGENIQAWLSHTQAGRHEQAWRQLVADNPLPAIHGRVCYHPCESVCNRADLDSAVSIHSVERFLGDLALEQGWQFDPPPVRSGKRVLVVGAGPCGLSAAYHLSRLGHEVEIRDSGEETGGMMRYGIPAYRLPRDVLTGELDRIAAMGVRVTCGHRVEDLVAERAGGRLRRGLRRGRGAPLQAGRHPGPRCRPDRRRGVVPAQRRLRRAAGDRPARRGLRRRQHRDGRRPGRPPDGRGRGADRLPADSRADAGPSRGGRGRRAGRRADQLAADDHGLRRPGAAGRADGARRVRLPAADRPVRDARRRHGDPGARPGVRHRVPAPGAGSRDRARRDRAGVDVAPDRKPRRVRGRRHGAERADRDRRRRATARRPRATSTPGCAAPRP